MIQSLFSRFMRVALLATTSALGFSPQALAQRTIARGAGVLEDTSGCVITTDETLWCIRWEGSQWMWRQNVAYHSGVELAPHNPRFWVEAGDVWYASNPIHPSIYLNYGRPASTTSVLQPIAAFPGLGGTTVGSEQWASLLFMVTRDGHLWSFDDIPSIWTDHSEPPGTSIYSPLGATAIGLQAYIWVLGGDGAIWQRRPDRLQWRWDGQPLPSGFEVAEPVGGASRDGRPYLFLLGTDGNLWSVDGNLGAGNWSNHGKPAGTEIGKVIGSTSSAIVYIIGADGNLWERYPIPVSTGTLWVWSNWSTMNGECNTRCLGPNSREAVGVATRGGQRWVYVIGADGHLWNAALDGTSYDVWNDLGTPP